MSQRPLLAEHSVAICLAVTGFATGGAALAVVAGSVAVMTAVGLDWLASCDRATRRAIQRSVEQALDQFGRDIPEDQIAAAEYLLRTGAHKFRFDTERMAEAVRRGDAPQVIMRDLFGDLTAQDPGTVTALKIGITAAFDAFRKHPKYREALTQDMVMELLKDHPIEVAWRQRMETKQDAQTVMLQELLRRTDGFAGAVQSADGLTLEELQALAAAFGETTLSGKPELVVFLTEKAAEYESYRAQIEHIDERTAGLGNLKAAARDAAERLDFEEVETLLARVDEVETEIAAQTKELRADNALLRGRVEEAYRLLSAAADSFASVDEVGPAKRRLWKYTEKLLSHGQRYGGIGLALSGEMTREALPAFEDEKHSREIWAAHVLLGAALTEQGIRMGGEAGAALLGEAVAAYRAALRVRSEAEHPLDWATTQNNLGNALASQGSRTGGETCAALRAEAVAAYRAALRVYTEAAHPVGWATTQNNLGAALSDQGSRTGGETGAALRAEAVAACRAALRVRTEAEHPVDWATTQNNLGTALCRRGERTGAAMLAESVAAFRAALRVYTEANHPVDWAMTQNNLGSALRYQGRHTGGEAGAALLAEAVAAYRAALQVRTEADHPVDWASTMKNIAWAEAGIALHESCADPVLHLQNALEAVMAALRVYDPEHMPYDYGTATEFKAKLEKVLAGFEGGAE